MNEINLSNWNARAALRSLEQWQEILQWQMSLREKIWDLKIAVGDLKTQDLLFDAMYVLESAVEYAQVQVKERGGEVC